MLERAHVSDRARAGLGLDAAHASRQPRLAHDLEETDVAGAKRMRPAAVVLRGEGERPARCASALEEGLPPRLRWVRDTDRSAARANPPWVADPPAPLGVERRRPRDDLAFHAGV